MITALSHATIYCLDQDEALAFYTDKLGFEVRTDISMEGFRWLTVGAKDQPDLQLVLMPLMQSPMMSAETVEAMKGLLQKGAFGTGVMTTEDCQATYEVLSAKGVEFMQPPQERPYGIEALFRDNSGNWFSLTQPREFQG